MSEVTFDPKEIKANLIAVRDLLANGWCQGSLARTADNKFASTDSDDAALFCMFGALMRIYKGEIDKGIGAVVYECIRHAGGITHSLCDWNDRPVRTHAEVLEAVDKAIATL